MNAEFVAVLEHWEREKNIPKERLFQAVEESLLDRGGATDQIGPPADEDPPVGGDQHQPDIGPITLGGPITPRNGGGGAGAPQLARLE